MSLVPGATAVNILFLQTDNRLYKRWFWKGALDLKVIFDLQGGIMVLSCETKTEMFPASLIQVKGGK